MRKSLSPILQLFFFSFLAFPAPAADSNDALDLNVKKFSLNNNMTFLVVERHTTPQIACRLVIRAGSAFEQTGQTGTAHMIEHLLFKGTKNFGTLDPVKDLEFREKIATLHRTLLDEQLKDFPDQQYLTALQADMEKLRREAQALFIPQVFKTQLARNRAVHVNAYTNVDQTHFQAFIPSDMLEQWFSIISEQVLEPAFREFYEEKEVIRREWDYRYTGNPAGAAWIDLFNLSFTTHPYRHPVLGQEADIDRLNIRDAIAFHKKYYTPNNAICVLVGDVTLEQAKKWAEIYFSRYPMADPSPAKLREEPRQEGPRRNIRLLSYTGNPLIRIGYHAATTGTKDFSALKMLELLLNDRRNGRLVQNLLNRKQAQEVWAQATAYRFAGLFILAGSPRELQQPDLTEEQKYRVYVAVCEELETRLLAEIEKIKTEPIDEAMLRKVKNSYFREYLEQARSHEALADRLAGLIADNGRNCIQAYLQKLDAVTPAEIQSAAMRYLDQNNRNSVYVIPSGKAEVKRESYNQSRISTNRTASNPAPNATLLVNFSDYPTPKDWRHPLTFKRIPQKIRYPQPEVLKIDKTTLFYIPDHELPLIHLNIMFRIGSAYLPDNRVILAKLFERGLVPGGTLDHGPEEFEALLDENGIKLSVSVQEEQSNILLSVQKKDWEKALPLLTELLTKPRFDPMVQGVIKNSLLTDLKHKVAEAETDHETFIRFLKGHPPKRDPLSDLDSLSRLTGQDLLNFLQTYFVPKNMVIAVSGDIDRKKIVADLQKLVQTLPDQEAPDRNLPDSRENQPALFLIHKPGQSRSRIYFSLPGLQRNHKDYWKLDLLLKGINAEDSPIWHNESNPTSKSNNLRNILQQNGLLIGYTISSPEQTPDIILELTEAMNRLPTVISAEKIEPIRLEALNRFIFTVDTPMDLAETYARYYLHGEKPNTLEKIQEAYLNTNATELRTLAGRWLNPRKLRILIFADKNTPLKKSGDLETTLEQDLKALSERLNLPYQEIQLR